MNKSILKIPKQKIFDKLPKEVRDVSCAENLTEIGETSSSNFIRKRSYKLVTEKGPNIHISLSIKLRSVFERTKAFNAIFPKHSCKPLFLTKINEIDLFAQEFFDGKTLEYLCENSLIKYEQAELIINKIRLTFAGKEKKSSIQLMEDEFDLFSNQFNKIEDISEDDKLLIKHNLFKEINNEFSSTTPTIRWSPGDLIPRNIVVNKNHEFRIIDLEFATETHFHHEDWMRLSEFCEESFRKLKFAKELAENVPSFIKPYHYLKQILLNKNVLERKKYNFHLQEDIISALTSVHPTKDKNSVLDSLIAKIKIYKEEKSNEENEKDIIISIKEDEFQKKQHELKNINIKLENKLNELSRNLIIKDEEMSHLKSINSKLNNKVRKKSRELNIKNGIIHNHQEELIRRATDYKELHDLNSILNLNLAESVTNLQNVEDITSQLKHELEIKKNKILRMEKSFSWQVTGSLRFLRRNILDKFKKRNLKNQNDENQQFSISNEDYMESIYFPYSNTKKDEDIIVVIPIYFALDYLRKCLFSIKSYYPNYHIFLIDDSNSADASSELHKILDNLNISSSKIHLFINQKNIGFVQSVNRAISEISAVMNPKHILLLNSDTELTKGCIEEMKSVIEYSDRHGAVSPRSNNASIQTFPFSSELDALESYELWTKNKADLPKYHIIPTCVGFCMLIKYDLIQRYGMFSEIYDKGYNEENDFCSRINRFGYSSISSNHSFVFHHSSKSFDKTEKKYLEDSNRAKLNFLYPEYTPTVNSFHEENTPLKYEKTLICRKSIIFDFQDLPNYHNGTSEFAIKILNEIHNINKYFDLHILVSKKSYLFHRKKIPTGVGIHFLEGHGNKFFDICFRPMQFFTNSSLERSRKIANKLIFVMQDIITIRTNYLRTKELHNIFQDSVKNADKIISISNTVHDDLNAYFDLRIDTQVIHHGLEALNTSTTSNKQYILVVGNKFHHKSLAECIRKINCLNYKFKVIGIEKPINDYKNIDYVSSGDLSDKEVENLYKESTLIIYPSSYEGFGLPICHAIKYSKAIICFENQLNFELKEYFSFFPGIHLISSFSELEECITKAQEEKIKKYDIKYNFTWEAKAKEYYTIFNEKVIR